MFQKLNSLSTATNAYAYMTELEQATDNTEFKMKYIFYILHCNESIY